MHHEQCVGRVRRIPPSGGTPDGKPTEKWTDVLHDGDLQAACRPLELSTLYLAFVLGKRTGSTEQPILPEGGRQVTLL